MVCKCENIVVVTVVSRCGSGFWDQYDDETAVVQATVWHVENMAFYYRCLQT